LPHDKFGTHLNSSGKTVDIELEKMNFRFAAESLSAVWNENLIDDYPVSARYVDPTSDKPEYGEALDKKWRLSHVRTSQYFTQLVKCLDESCCAAFQSGYLSVFPDRFLPPPIRYMEGLNGTVCKFK